MLHTSAKLGKKPVSACSLAVTVLVGGIFVGAITSPISAQEVVLNTRDRTTEIKPKRATTAQSLARVQQEDFCKTRVNLKVQNATLRNVLAQVGVLLPKDAKIEVRNPGNSARFTLDLAKMPVGDLLQ